MMYTRFRPLSLTCLPIASCGPSFCHDAEKKNGEHCLPAMGEGPALWLMRKVFESTTGL